ncbi:MAG TPA: tetratricopeptide repeat protein [Candidatus Acidoferrales bacterium]|nr:tetratricopeptide repeat protein [Candidatus Acidoferrales bacterium]
MPQSYTRKEVERILGVKQSRLRYWERLQLIYPESRWGERFYSFGDLVSLQTLQRLTESNIPASRVKLAISLVEEQFEAPDLRLHQLSTIERGSEILIVPPGDSRPFDPIHRQWGLPFETSPAPEKVHSMSARSAEELFETALQLEARPDSLPDAAEHYRRVLDRAPNWIEAHINLGVALYQMGMTEEARAAFLSAVQLDPANGISRYNLGCVLEEQGRMTEAIEHLSAAARAMPKHADVHFNLALAYEKSGARELARQEWALYLRHAPNGAWAQQARDHLRLCSERRQPSAPIPFPSKTSPRKRTDS